MAVVNPGFETAGSDAGEAANWTWFSSPAAQAEAYAVFGSIPYDDEENFERGWTNDTYLFAFDPFVDIVAPLFDTNIGTGEVFEDFEEGWSLNHGYSFALGSAELATFDVGTPEPFEDFEEEWDSNESYDFDMGSTTAALFNTSDAAEDFEEGWDSNENYDFEIGSLSSALFDDAFEAVEDFEETFGPIVPSSIDYATSTFFYAGHGLVDTDIVRVRPEPDAGLLPTPLQTDTNYFVVSASTDTFRLAPSSGGTPIVLGAAGFGVAVTRDPATHWPVDGPT